MTRSLTPCLFWALLAIALPAQSLTPSSYLTAADRDRFRQVFTSSLSADAELSTAHYGILGLSLLGETAPQAKEWCQRLQDKMSGSAANIYQAASAGKALKCSMKPSADATQALKTALSSDASVADLYHAALAQQALGVKVEAAAVLKTLQSALKKDDSLSNLGYAFRLASALDGDAKSVFDRVEDAVVQADEVDGKLLQFEGGLGVTNMIITGAYDLSGKAKKSPPISKMQAVKFANYFLSRKSVQSAKGCVSLLEAFKTLTENKFHLPVAVTLAPSSSVVSESSPKVQVVVTDLNGKSLGKMDVTVENAMRQSDGAVVMSKNKMAPVGSDGSKYEVDMMAAKPSRGFYELTITAIPARADERLVGNEQAVLLVKTLGSIVVSNAEIGVADADQSTAPKLTEVVHPKKHAKALSADHHHKIVFKFALVDKQSKEKVRVHQAFVRMTHSKTGAEIIFVAEPDSNSVYKFDLDVSAKAKEFGGNSGLYKINLIVGDAVISNPISWDVADVNLKFPTTNDDADDSDDRVDGGKKPEITHKFREPEKRPPAAVSSLFTILCLAPILIMFVAWLKIGVNISNFPFSLTAIMFHLGLGGIFGLYYCFWLRLDMFSTVQYLIMIGVVTFLCGNSVLVRIANKRKMQ